MRTRNSLYKTTNIYAVGISTVRAFELRYAVLGRQRLEDMVRGATILGTGGGGTARRGWTRLLQVLRENREVKLVKPRDVPDDATAAVVFGMGSPAISNERWLAIQLLKALEGLQDHLGRKIDIVTPLEIGGANTALALYTGAKAGIPTVDGDGAGRSIPELDMTTYNIFGVPINPMAIADALGNLVVLERVVNAYTAEKIGRMVVVQLGGIAGVVAWPMTGRQLKEVLIPHTVTTAEKLGRIVREKRAVGEDPIGALIEAVNGVELIRGRVIEARAWSVAGFDVGSSVIQGTDKHEGLTVKIDFKNENIVGWRGNKPIAISPDLICVVNTETGEGVTNIDIREGLRVTVLGIPAHEKWRKKEGFAAFRRLLKAFGYDGEYIPVKELQRSG